MLSRKVYWATRLFHAATANNRNCMLSYVRIKKFKDFKNKLKTYNSSRELNYNKETTQNQIQYKELHHSVAWDSHNTFKEFQYRNKIFRAISILSKYFWNFWITEWIPRAWLMTVCAAIRASWPLGPTCPASINWSSFAFICRETWSLVKWISNTIGSS